MFERDKTELRELGVPLETGRHSEFDTADGYRIARHDYELGEIDLEPDEAAARRAGRPAVGVPGAGRAPRTARCSSCARPGSRSTRRTRAGAAAGAGGRARRSGRCWRPCRPVAR